MNESPTLEYNLAEKLGEGAYAIVYKAYLKSDTKKLYPLAVKQTKPDNKEKWTGIQIDAIREIYALRRANHPNVMKLYDVFIENGFTNLVYEYLDIGLDKIISGSPLSEPQAKTYFKMLIEGVNYLHNTLHILHLDIAPKNLLISYNPDTKEPTLKIADFGLSYTYCEGRCAMAAYQNVPELNPLTSPPELLEPTAITLPYRAPELLYGATQYGPPTDMWSCGCVFAEMLMGSPLFPGRTEAEQKQLIAKCLGMPNDTVWPGFSSLSAVESGAGNTGRTKQLQQRTLQPGRSMERKGIVGLGPSSSKTVIMKLLNYNPLERPTASGILRSSYIKEGCCPLNELPYLT